MLWYDCPFMQYAPQVQLSHLEQSSYYSFFFCKSQIVGFFFVFDWAEFFFSQFFYNNSNYLMNRNFLRPQHLLAGFFMFNGPGNKVRRMKLQGKDRAMNRNITFLPFFDLEIKILWSILNFTKFYIWHVLVSAFGEIFSFSPMKFQ